MVKVDQETHRAFLRPYSNAGSYVPRFLFLGADGTLKRANTSGHPRYPYFFHSNNVGGLKAAMGKAASG